MVKMLSVFIINSKQKVQIQALSRNLCLKIKTFSISSSPRWRIDLACFRSNSKKMLRTQLPNKSNKVSKHKMIIKCYWSWAKMTIDSPPKMCTNSNSKSSNILWKKQSMTKIWNWTSITMQELCQNKNKKNLINILALGQICDRIRANKIRPKARGNSKIMTQVPNRSKLMTTHKR